MSVETIFYLLSDYTTSGDCEFGYLFFMNLIFNDGGI